MATQEEVAIVFHAQLNNDSRAQSIAAGNKWTGLPLSFFYSTEVSVDLGVKATMLRILELEHATLAGQHFATLSSRINMNTPAGEAVNTIALISTAAQRHDLPL
jgi:hypothetical protein